MSRPTGKSQGISFSMHTRIYGVLKSEHIGIAIRRAVAYKQLTLPSVTSMMHNSRCKNLTGIDTAVALIVALLVRMHKPPPMRPVGLSFQKTVTTVKKN
jgi:hypothetical protein